MRTLVTAVCLAGIVALASPAMAVPALQLDIEGGYYDFASETVVIDQSSPFTVYAILTEKNQASVMGDYYLSVALLSADGSRVTGTSPTIGTFYIDTDVRDATVGATVGIGDMQPGVPPLETNIAQDPGDLSTHDIFPTYFAEYGFNFDTSQTTTTYNTGYDYDDPTAPITPGGMTGGLLDPSGTGSYYYAFYLDAMNLSPEYSLHFDLYSTMFGETDIDIDRDLFAPFSHDAGTRTVPEPSSLLLLGVGMIGLVSIRRKLTRSA